MAARGETLDRESAIGVISDTHGLVRPEVLSVFKGVDMIVHAGDIGDMSVLKTLEAIAPVTAVSGNMDRGLVAAFLNETETFEFGTVTIHVLHDLSRLTVDPVASGIHMVISGHTHLPDLRSDNGVIYLNPGSAGPPRGKKPISIAKATLKNGHLQAIHHYL